MTSRPFFDFWRARADFIERLDPHENFYEANVLVWATLDALAGLWVRCMGGAPTTDRRRLGEFLAEHGGDPFRRVSLPALWVQADALDPAISTAQVCDRLRLFGGRRAPSTLEERQARAVGDDPRTDEALAELSEIATTVVRRNRARTSTVEDLVLGARLGEIAYTEMRCAIVHEGRLGRRAHAFDFGADSDKGPTYLSGIFAAPPTIGFSPRFMVMVIRRCVDGFEAEATAAGRDPVPPAEGCIELVDGDEP